MQRASCKTNPPGPAKCQLFDPVSVVWFSYNFLSDLQFSNISWRDINVATQKTEGKMLSGKTNAPAHRNRTEVLELDFMLRTKVYLWIKKTGTKTWTITQVQHAFAHLNAHRLSSELNVLLVTDCRLPSHFLVDLLEQTGHGMNSPLTKIRNKLTQDKK